VDYQANSAAGMTMDSCIQMGYRLPAESKYWQTIEQGLKKHQQADGSWKASSLQKNETAFAVTLSALNALLLAQDYGESEAWLHCSGNPAMPEIEKGLNWLGDHFPKSFDAGGPLGASTYPVLCELERLGKLSGHKYLGKHDWFSEGADWLVKHQRPDGSFGDDADLDGQNKNRISTTSLALLYLAKGHGAILINKLKYDVTIDGRRIEGHWNQRPGDVATLVRWSTRNEYSPLNWQIVNLKDSSDEDLHQAPILYISGDQALSFAPEEETRLKRYIEQGGLIYANPDGIEDAYNFNYPFATSYFALVAKLYPQYVYSEKEIMKTLPANHPYYTMEQFKQSEVVHKNLILTINNGVRNLMEFIRVDYAKRWQGRMYIKTDEWRNLSNLYMYETSGRNIRHKGETALVVPDPSVHPSKILKLARIQYDGNYDPEPGAWLRVGAVLHNSGIDLQTSNVKLGTGALKGFTVAHITGTKPVVWTAGERVELKDFIAGGGTLLIDSAGNSEAFTDSVQWELVAMFGSDAAQLGKPAAADDAIYKGATPLIIESRPYARTVEKDFRLPQLRGIKIGDRWGVLLSREDLTSGLAGIYTDGLVTYTPESATALAVRVLGNLAK